MKFLILLFALLTPACATITESASTLQRTACANRERVEQAITLVETALAQCPMESR